MLASYHNANLPAFPGTESTVNNRYRAPSTIAQHPQCSNESDQMDVWQCQHGHSRGGEEVGLATGSSLDHTVLVGVTANHSCAESAVRLKIGLTIRAVVRLGRDSNVSK